MPGKLSLDQTKRPFRVTTPGEVTMYITAMIGQEELARPFEFTLTLVSEKAVKPDSMLGKDITVELDLASGSGKRYWNGLLQRLELVQVDDEMFEYRATLVPWFSMLKNSVDYKIYQSKSPLDVVKDVFQEFGFSDFTDKTTQGGGTVKEYVVQYAETTFNFVSRLLEQEGIYYYFTHESGKHTMVLCDGPSAHSSNSDAATMTYTPEGSQAAESVNTWGTTHDVVTGKYTVNDYDFTAPSKALTENQVAAGSYANASMEVYEYPGRYSTSTDGSAYAKIRLGSAQAASQIFRGESTYRATAYGYTMSFEEHPTDDGTYLVTGTKVKLTSDDYMAEMQGIKADQDAEKEELFFAEFTAIKSDAHFYPPERTERPVINGPQTATVTGPSGEEIYTDKYGRIKVQFNWDRLGKSDDNTTCFIRVAQVLSSVSWGSWFLPRIGMEVIVNFLDGDPDQPLVTGCLYNGTNAMPRALPDNKNISYLRTNSTKGGNGFHEIGWDDTKGSENQFTTSQKDENHVVNNMRYDGVGQDSHLTINNDRYDAVGQDHHDLVTRDQKTKVGRDLHLTVAGKSNAAITGQMSLKVTGDVGEEFGGNHSEATTSAYYLKAKDVTIEATDNITLMIGDNYIAINSSGIKISTTGQMVLESTGALSITSKTDAMTVKATTGVSVDAGGGDFAGKGVNLSMEGSAEATVKGGAQATLQGGGTATIKGGVVMIN